MRLHGSHVKASRLGRPRLDDSWLYDADTVAVGVVLFGARTCAGCGLPLPRCTDYFTQSATAAGGLKYVCKRCTAARYREANREWKQRQRDRATAERLVREMCVRMARVTGASEVVGACQQA